VNHAGDLPVVAVMNLMKRRTRLVIAVGFALAAVGVMAAPAEAYTPSTSDDCTSVKIKNPSSVHIVVHTESLLGSDLQVSNMLAAIDAVTDELNTVGGTTAHISSVTTTTAAYHHKTSYHESDGTIHLGFAPVIKDDDGVTHVGQEVPFESKATPPLPSPCTVESPNIGFLDLDHISGWNFKTPGDTDKDQGNKFYKAGVKDLADHYYFRPQLLHELLHAFGLAHSDNTTAFMNYGQLPWINRSPDKMITPLPDDLAGLRHFYPGSGDVYRVAFLNTALDPAGPVSDGGAGTQSPLCHPSGGTTYASVFATYNYGCARSPYFNVCAGGQVYGAYSLANYSTKDMQVTVQAWFSTDDVWTESDHASVDYDVYTVATGKTVLIGDHWTMPSMQVGTLQIHVILRVVALQYTPGSAPPANSVTTDWLPLDGTVTTC
jgi:hypothetical protein